MDSKFGQPVDAPFDPASITRPDPVLLTYYMLVAILTVVGFPVVALVLWCKYHTLRYKFDDKGITMSWGLLFRREIYLTYRRIQDIHVTRNLFHRWLGLAAISVQTASGTSGAEMTIEGVLQAGPLRDFLYAQMRGARGESEDEESESEADEVLALLEQIRDEVHRLGNQGGAV